MTVKLVKPDNGYFEVWQRPDGTQVRVSTEDMQIALSRPGARSAFHARTLAQLAKS